MRQQVRDLDARGAKPRERRRFAAGSIRASSAVVVFGLRAGCASPKQPPVLPAVQIAKQALLQEYGGKKVRAECDRAADGGWSVTTWRLPETPGGFFVVAVSADGRVTVAHPAS
jgi:hypothetical protein